VERKDPGEGDEAFRVVLDLPRGANDVRLISRLPDVRVPGLSRRTFAGYRLLLPIALWRDEERSAVDGHGDRR